MSGSNDSSAASASASSPHRKARWWLRVLRSAALLLFLSLLLPWLPGCAEFFLLHPQPGPYRGATIKAGRALTATPAHKDALAARFFDGAEGAPAVLVSHGNGGNLDHYARFVRFWRALGCPVLIYDYRGFGNSQGTIDLDTLPDDARAALALLRAQPECADRKVIAHGISMGSTVSLLLAAEQAVDALLIDGCADLVGEIHRRDLWVGWPLAEMLALQIPAECRTPDTAPLAESPAVFIHGDRDPITALELAQATFARYRGEKRFVLMENTGHSDDTLARFPKRYREAALWLIARVAPDYQAP